MEYKITIKARVMCADDELIGAKEAISDALELMGIEVDKISVVGGEE